MRRRKAGAELPEHLRERARYFADGWVGAARQLAEENVAWWLAWQESGGRVPAGDE